MQVFDTKFNETRHECELYLDNGSEQFDINPNAVVNLTIHNTMSEWVTRGVLTFYFYPEAGEGIYDSNTGQYSTARTGIRSSTGGSSLYRFANDGTDILRVRINPKLANDGGQRDFSIQDKVHWTLSHKFAVYNIEDIDLPSGAQNAASADLKCLKLHFWDHHYQKLQTNQLEYSTALSEKADIEGDKSAGLYSNYGSIPTGLAIKEILKKGLEGYDENIFGPDDTWEDGASRLFFTSPAGVSANESITHIYNQHLSNKSGEGDIHDVSMLVKERGPNYNDTGYFALRPLQYYFEKSTNGSNPGELQMEHFFLQGYTSSSDKNPTKRFRAPVSNDTSDTVDVKLSKYNIVTNYRFVDNASVTNEEAFRSSPVHSFDFKNRKFKVDFEQNTVYKAKDYISKQYIDKVYKKGSGDDLFLMNINDDKKTKNIEPMFSLHGDDNDDHKKLRQLPGIQKLLNLGVFQNAAVNFRTLGLTSREPGNFVAIDKTEGVMSGDFEDKFFGQWFVLDVKHVFEAGSYYNDVTAIKAHRYQAKGGR